VVLISCNYINIPRGIFLGLFFILLHFTLTLFHWDSSSFTLSNSCALGWSI
jgi:hypothetical protein